MEERSDLALPKERTQEYEEAMRRNLAALMRSGKMSQTQLKDELEKRGLSVQQGNLSLYLSGRKSIPLSIIVQLCDIFRVSLAELVSEDFCESKRPVTQMPQIYSDDLMNLIPSLGEAFVSDPASSYFNGYLDTYHAYLFPSRMDTETIRTGLLKLTANGSICEATLEINTNKVYDGEPYIKIYRGRCIISTTVRTVYILLTNQMKGELSFLSFNYFNLAKDPLNCRIAATLINATGMDNPPTVQRIFLSRTEINPEHLELLKPHLYLNSNTISIRQEHMDALREENPLYGKILDLSSPMHDPVTIYQLNERTVMDIAKGHMTKLQAQIFLSRLRSLSEHECFNKVSLRADELSHRLLRSLGYYMDRYL